MTTSISPNDLSRADLTAHLREAVHADEQATIRAILSQWPVQPRHGDIELAESGQLWPFYIAFWAAIEFKNLGIVSRLLEQGIAVERGAVHEAIRAGSVEVFERFLEYGWDINMPLGGQDPPALAHVLGDDTLLSWFLSHGADPNAAAPKVARTPLTFAANFAPLSTIKTLFAHGARPINVLQTAAESKQEGRLEVMEYLLDNGADVNARKWEDHAETWSNFELLGLGTALHYAARVGDVGKIRLLLERGARVGIGDSTGYTPLEYAGDCCDGAVKEGDEDRKRECRQCVALLEEAERKLSTISPRM